MRLHAGTHVCTRVHAGTRVCTGLLHAPVCGGTPGCTRLEGHVHTYVCAHRDAGTGLCSPPHRCVHTLKHRNVCVYIYKNIYIHMCTQARVQRTWAVHARICAAIYIHRCEPTRALAEVRGCVYACPYRGTYGSRTRMKPGSCPYRPGCTYRYVHMQVPMHTWPRTPPV